MQDLCDHKGRLKTTTEHGKDIIGENLLTSNASSVSSGTKQLIEPILPSSDISSAEPLGNLL